MAEMTLNDVAADLRAYSLENGASFSADECAQIARLIDAAIKQREQDAAMVLVPKVPTSAMLDAAVALALNVTVHGAGGWSNYMRDVWETMLSAQEAGQ